MAGAELPLFLIVVVLWIGFRFLFRRWLWRSVANGRVSMRTAVVLHSASFAVLPLLAIPFVPWAWIILVLASVTLLVFSLAISRLAVAVDKSNPAPK